MYRKIEGEKGKKCDSWKDGDDVDLRFKRSGRGENGEEMRKEYQLWKLRKRKSQMQERGTY